MGQKRNTCRLLVRKPEGKRSLEKLMHRWVANIRMYHAEIGWAGVD
jgi:hypothetical protein